jgi:Ca2+-binding RTX toxin-like protein
VRTLIACRRGNDTVFLLRHGSVHRRAAPVQHVAAACTPVTVNLGSTDVTTSDLHQSSPLPERQCFVACLRRSRSRVRVVVNTITGGFRQRQHRWRRRRRTVIAAGAGNDTVSYRGSESSIDGGADLDTLILAASGGITAINLAVAAGSDQTTGDSVGITNFENVGCVCPQFGPVRRRRIRREYDHDRFRQRCHQRRRRGRRHQCRSRGRRVVYNGTETSIDGGSGSNTLAMGRGGDGRSRQCRSDFRRFNQRRPLPARQRVVFVVGRINHGFVGCKYHHRRFGDDTIDGAGGSDIIAADNGSDTVTYRGTETSIDGGSGVNTLVMAAAATVNLGNADQTPSIQPTLPISRTSMRRHCRQG